MKITRERACQRRHHRLVAPLFVEIDGRGRIQANDWSVEGLGLALGDSTLLEIGVEVGLHLTLPFQGYDMSFDARAKVVRIDSTTGTTGLAFVDLPDRSRDLLLYFSEDLIRGRMGSVEDSICRIDIPVTPISTKPTTSHVEETPFRRWPIKTIIMSSAYICLGFFVLTYLAVILAGNLLRLEVQSSVVSTDLQTLKMPVDGLVRRINFNVGERVERGDEIMRFSDQKLENAIQDSRIKIEAARRNIWRMEEKKKIETERLKLYQVVSRTDKEITQARLAAAGEVLKGADAHLVRIMDLHRSGVATKAQIETARQAQARATANVAEQTSLLEKNTAMDAVSERRHYNHKEFGADLDLMALDLDAAYSTLQSEILRLEDLDKMKERLVLHAPFDGRIVSLLQTAATSVGRNEPLLVLERSDRVSITAYLNQSEILEVGLYDEARVFVPALDFRGAARVTRIDRSSLMLDRKATHYAWRDKSDRTAIVVLELDMKDIADHSIRAGLPVVVIFDKRGTSEFWSKIRGIAGSRETPSTEADTGETI